MNSINNSNDFLSSSDDDISVASDTEVEPPMTKTEQKKPVKKLKTKKVVRMKKKINKKEDDEAIFKEAERDNGGEASNDDAEPAVEVKTETTTTTTTTTKKGGKKKVKTALEVLCPTQEELDFIKENWGDDLSKEPSEMWFDESWTIRQYKLLKALETEYYKSLKGKRAKRINAFGSLELGSKSYTAMKKYFKDMDRVYHLDAYKGAIEEYIFMKFNRINAIDFNVIDDESESGSAHKIRLFFQNDFLDGWLDSDEGKTMLDKYQEQAVKFEGGKKKRQKKPENKKLCDMTDSELEIEIARRKALKE